MAEMENAALGWDDSIEGTVSEFEPVEPGEYQFRVVSIERAYHNGSANMGPCPVAKVEIELMGAPRAAHVFDRLYLNKKVMWKIVAFFTAIGLHEKGDDTPFKPDWQRAAGRTGRASIGIHEYNGSRYNEVKRWLAPKDVAPAQQAAPAWTAPANAQPMPPAMQAQVNQAVAQAQQAAQHPTMTPGAF